MPDRLGPYLCDLHRAWLADEPESRFKELEASLLFFDISGFTPLTERLAKRGKAGVEQLIDTLNGVVAPLVATAGALGGDTLKFGGDALLLLFSGDDHEQRACAAAFDMQAAMQPLRRMRTPGGIVSLRASAAVASGPVHLFLVGGRFRELIVAGPTTSEVMSLEGDAKAGQVLLGRTTCAQLHQGCRAADRGDGVALLAGRPDVAHTPRPPPRLDDPRRGLPQALHDHLGPDAESEHRQVTVGFAQFRGLDDLLARAGPQAAADELDALLHRVQQACDTHGVTFLATDADRGAGKVFVVAGAPTASTDDEDRMLFALREIVAHVGALRVRAGVNRGRAFAVHLGAPHRRTYTTMGDTTNLAARVMGKAPDGQVLATRAVLDHARAPFALAPVAPFAVKGKRLAVEAELVGEPRAVAPRAVVDTALAGRDAELAVLRGAIAAARSGDGRVVELVAEPGMGKSRLVAEVTAEARQAGLRTLVIEAGAYGTATPYFALRAPLRALLDARDGSDGALAEALGALVGEHVLDAAPLLPLIAVAFGLELPATEESKRLASDFKRAQLHFLVDALLAAILAPRETLLIVEDAHWLDDASSDLLATLLRGAGERGWAVFVTRRPGDDGFTELPGVRMRIELEPLAPEAAHSLVVAGAGGALAPHVTAALVERSHGNPLFLRELIAAARGGAELDELPATVEALLTARIDTLMPADRRLLRRAAVLGQRFSMAWLRGMLDMPDDELRAGLERLGDFLEVEPGRVRFQHALQREAAYEALPFERRRALHARAGELIERELGVGADDSADILALHFLRAQEYVRAWSYGLAAAEQARDSYAHADAAQLYRRTLEAARALTLPAAELSEVYEALGESHAHSGELRRADEAFARARKLAAGDRVRQAQLMHRHARAAMDGGQVVRAARWLLRAMRTLQQCDTDSAVACRATIVSELAGARARVGRMEEAISLAQAAIADAEAAGADAPLAHACYVLDWALVHIGRGTEAVHSERALEVYRRLGDLDREAVVLNNLGTFAYHEGRWDDAVALYRAGAEASTKAGNVGSAAFGDCNVGEVRSDQGRRDEARPRLERALEIWRGTGYEWGVAFATALLGRLAARAGDGDGAQALLHDALERFRVLRVSPDALWVEAFVAEAHVLAGNPEDAQADVARLIDVAAGGHLGPLLYRVLGLARAQLGQAAEARTALEAAVDAARDRSDEFDLFLSLDALHALLRREGDVDDARRRERDAIGARLDIAEAPPVPLSRPVTAPARAIGAGGG
jgi:class 3 adenylate cyclase/tetratricopeptide (TPR) repeat protein